MMDIHRVPQLMHISDGNHTHTKSPTPNHPTAVAILIYLLTPLPKDSTAAPKPGAHTLT